MFISNDQLKKILLDARVIDEGVWDSVYKDSSRLGMGVEDVLRERDIIKGHTLYEIVARAIHIPYANLKKQIISEDVLELFDNETVSLYKAIPFELDTSKKMLKIAFLDPTDKKAIAVLEKKSGYQVVPYFTGMISYKLASRYYQKEVAAAIKKIIEYLSKKSAPLKKNNGSDVIFEKLLEYVYYTQPSDIHIESHYNGGMVKFRIDGFLRDEFLLPRQSLRDVIEKIKKEAHIRTDQQHPTADGHFSREIFGEVISFRLSIVPAYYGENVALRVRNEAAQKVSLVDLGVRPKDIDVIKEEIKKPYGLILVAGPTGSGKSSTLYTLVKSLNIEGVSIATIEDPIEYSIKHINQTQVDVDRGFTFASGLRALLRQDPNIIMVGEIRDDETASITIQSALTGHIVMSTIHSNTAVGAITRLRNMDLKSYFLAPTLNLIVSQRLLKRICESCRKAYNPGRAFFNKIDKDTNIYRSLQNLRRAGFVSFDSYEKIWFYTAPGCARCKGLGTVGRVGVFEILSIDDDIRRLILQDKTEDHIQRMAEEKGMLTLFEDGLLKVLQGKTTIEEIMSVINV
ncbi:MAG: ATPase, T2SS/T4P/T4SS family [bacterium]|nr:ATPase, T2SS/T4P/T4SS family [bacterium]